MAVTSSIHASWPSMADSTRPTVRTGVRVPSAATSTAVSSSNWARPSGSCEAVGWTATNRCDSYVGRPCCWLIRFNCGLSTSSASDGGPNLANSPCGVGGGGMPACRAHCADCRYICTSWQSGVFTIRLPLTISLAPSGPSNSIGSSMLVALAVHPSGTPTVPVPSGSSYCRNATWSAAAATPLCGADSFCHTPAGASALATTTSTSAPPAAFSWQLTTPRAGRPPRCPVTTATPDRWSCWSSAAPVSVGLASNSRPASATAADSPSCTDRTFALVARTATPRSSVAATVYPAGTAAAAAAASVRRSA